MNPLPSLDCPPLADGRYERWFTDVSVWARYVAWVADRHGLPAPTSLSVGTPGSHPVFLTAGGYVVKFFAPHWPEDAWKEPRIYRLLAMMSQAAIPHPKLLAADCLFPGRPWAWPYMVLELAKGAPVAAVAPSLGVHAWRDLAGALGRVVRTLHSVSWESAVPGLADRSARDLTEWRRSAPDRRHSEPLWERLDFAGWEAYWAAAFSTSAPVRSLVHGDLTADNLFVRVEGTTIHLASIIDWADVMGCDPAYDLVPLYIDLFRCQPALLRAFRSGYGEGPLFRPGWQKRATAFLLAFRFDLGSLLNRVEPALSSVTRLEDVEALLWDGVS